MFQFLARRNCEALRNCFLKAFLMLIPQHHYFKVLEFVCTMKKEKALVLRKHYNFGCAGVWEEAPCTWAYMWLLL
jgi:hypothetical protein